MVRRLVGTEKATFAIAGEVEIVKSSITEKALSRMRKALTLTLRGYGGLSEDEEVRAYRETETCIYVPRYYGYGALGLTIQPSPGVRHKVEADFKFVGKLRDYQEPATEAVIEGLLMQRGGLLIAKAGAGKTIMALRIIEAMGVRTVVLVHAEFLLTQWRDRIAEYLPGTRVGFISQDTCDLQPISIAMIQTVMRREGELADAMSSFGMVISDECHRMSAPIFSRAIAVSDTEYRLGLTATPRRSDGLGDVFGWHLGPSLATVTEGQLSGKVWLMDTGITVDQRFWMASKEDWFTPGILKMLIKSRMRNEKLLTAITRAADAGRHTLVLSHRREHLTNLHDSFGAQSGWSHAYYVGGMTARKRKEAESARVIFGTYKMAKEGLDIPSLDTLVLATPVGSIEQAAGRILRQYEGKKEPFIVDPIDRGGWVSDLAMYRRSQYTRLGYEIQSL